MAERQPLRGLYAITPPGLGAGGDLAVVEAALRGGVVLVQYRDKDADAASRLATASALRRLCRAYGARLLINDDLALALSVGADGVHLGAGDGDLQFARQALPAGCLLGASCYGDFERARAAVAAGADYVAFGSVHASATKPLARPAALSLFARCRAELAVPSCAIGGITLGNAPPLLAAGADMLAVISDLFAAADVQARAAAYQSLFEDKPREFPQSATV
ncbi:MAG TPA: thiamine phosphate synthase [Candidatus Accumulibacter phosphatis]|nr:MAG: Thiamine-phosphate synthase [Candidatus Accumulibacter sp. SK-11]HAY27171.1 thiamine phosphate synthase [Accumulibacter sp.]HRL75031.1 thiamine phosphate synthase [Candidatus Accumulibacter phosphatis]HCN66685.1 thiamine phosphate synthase [Accumulibacter sp.]HCV13400.1 thiamine phosphate synthase [Accumulibacter sp.]